MENGIVRAETQSVSERDLTRLTKEIQYYWRKGQVAVLDCALEMGRRLTDAKGLLPHGSFRAWVEENFEFSHSSANSYMKLFDEYGADQLTLFGAVTESQTFANLPYTKALALLAVPKEEREEFAKEVGAEDLSVRELKKVIEEKKAAEAAQAEAEARERDLAEKLAAAEIAKAAAEALAKDAEEARGKVETLEANIKKRRESEQKLKDKLAEAEKNPKIPSDVLAKLKEEAEAEAKAAQGAEIEKQMAEAKAALESAEKAKAEAENVAFEATKKLSDMQKAQKMAAPAVMEFKVLFEQVQETVKKMKAKIEVVRAEDPETATRLEAAMKAFGGKL